MVTRSKVEIVKANPKYSLHVTTSSPIPKSPLHALRDPNWKQAMCDEYKALINNNTWVLVPRLPNINIVRSMWLYKHKYNADESLSRYKARLVANGYSQQQGIDSDETFSLVVKPATIQTVLSLAVSRQWTIHQLNVKNAFLHDHLTKTVYMHQPPGYTDSAHYDYVCLLQNKTDSSLFIFHKGPDTTYLLLYVDDIILTASSTSLMQRIISSLHAEFSMTDLGPLNYFLGISTTRTTSGIFLSQTKYAIEILEQAQMLNCSPATRRSTSGYCVFLSDNLLTWSSKRQDTLSRSSVETEYRGVTNAVAKTSWIRNLLRELHTPLFAATLVYCDNVSAVYMSTNPVQHQRTKHIEIDIHFVHDKVAAGHVRVLHTSNQSHLSLFGVAGANNDLTDLNHSPLFDDLLDDIAPVVPYDVNGVTFEKGYYLADGIYPQWAAFVKSFTVVQDERNVVFKCRQESAQKDVERSFGVLQGR
ncbi:ribonuclease H-like domain-containing protein [Tanacetum coccineum]